MDYWDEPQVIGDWPAWELEAIRPHITNHGIPPVRALPRWVLHTLGCLMGRPTNATEAFMAVPRAARMGCRDALILGGEDALAAYLGSLWP